MATISKKQIGIDARRKTAEGRFYQILAEKNYISITNALESISKAALIGWAGKVEREACIQAAADLFIESQNQLPQITMDRTLFISSLTAQIGKQKAATKLLTAAGEIGTATHSLIEWWARTYLGLDAGPRPTVGDKSEWAFMAFEDWAKAHHFIPIFSELVVFSHEHEIAGTLDLFGWVNDALKIVDIKTGKAVYGEAKLQCSAYWKCLTEMGHKCSDSAIVLRLPKIETDPEFEAVEVDNLPAYFDTFLHAKELRLWQIEGEKEYKSKLETAKEIA